MDEIVEKNFPMQIQPEKVFSLYFSGELTPEIAQIIEEIFENPIDLAPCHLKLVVNNK